ncbi:SDR family NAD(P)-dependent oxidoreductase [Streptomyces sp. NPDC047002]|uniref:SDR family NAD(P)-dependent oxidoreductase n=1 Tax=Streptomyces sp. NPDC047002 TaxID=3155475 RepID=UPI003455C245
MTEDTARGVAVVTGAGRNLGRAMALALAEAGHAVVVNTRADLAAAEAVAKEAEAYGVPARAVAADVTDPAQVERLMARAAELGPLRVLVNNAAVRTRIPAAELTFDDWRRALDITLDGAFRCVRAALPALRASGRGRIVNIIGGNALRGDPDRVHVSAAKHGLVGLTLALAEACAGDGITVNAVSPGHLNAPTEAETARNRAEVAAAVAFLASPRAAGVTGEVVSVGPRRPGPRRP